MAILDKDQINTTAETKGILATVISSIINLIKTDVANS
jgi:hypothetical protein